MTGWMRWLNGFAALCCGVAVALGAYSSHAAAGQIKERLVIAAVFGFAHGLALLALANRRSVLAHVARAMFALGIVAFSGSLVSAAFFSTSTAAAPFGGSLLMLGWLVAAVDFLRED